MVQHVAIIGSGPAGLRAAEVLARQGVAVTIYDRMPSVGRKFLMAGRGGLNITHSEDLEGFLPRYGKTEAWLTPIIKAFPPQALRDWCEGLEQKTFVGSSGRIFPEGMKASPLLRAWLKRLNELGVTFALCHEWQGWNNRGELVFLAPNKQKIQVKPAATLLALGGASWPKLGSDGGWTKFLEKHGITIAPLKPANCGFTVPWSDKFRERFAGQPLKPIILSFEGKQISGEAMITQNGIEGGGIYALSATLRDTISHDGNAILHIDLRPGLAADELTKKLHAPRGSQTLSNHLRKAGGLSPIAIALVQEIIHRDNVKSETPEELARLVKNLPLHLTGCGTIDRAISTAGGIDLKELDQNLMLRKLPGVFAAGEMLDWEAPTGGYLLQASFSTAEAAANGVLNWLDTGK